ncbi:MAG TPA: SpoVA/SpoVAEb family sporulation membrane protein, partial [Bacilli bacterium]|nr:SpoVA/SpoVAEb family sporulation membrane protein [Bacilli bacterium]
MEKKKYIDLVNSKSPKENIFTNAVVAFVVGGLMGIIGQFLIDFYSYTFSISTKQASIFMIVTLIFLGCLLTCLGFFDKVIHKARCGLLVPITGFANAMMSATLEYKKEGLITGIGTNMFKIAKYPSIVMINEK